MQRGREHEGYVDRMLHRVDGSPASQTDLHPTTIGEVGDGLEGKQVLVTNAVTGRDLAILISGAPLRDATGSAIGTVFVLQDISAIRALEQQRDRMLALVTHDLKNPLTSICGMSQLLQARIGQVEEPPRQRVAQGLGTIEAAARLMTMQISELLDYAQAQSGRSLELGLDSIDVVALLRQMVEEHQRSTERHFLELHSAEESIVTVVDASRLERAIANLLVNAIKYSPQGGPIVVSVVRAVGPDGTWLSITVADQGLGIPADELPHMFEQYYRASNVAATFPGTGIGLANVRHIIELHGGDVRIDSYRGGRDDRYSAIAAVAGRG